MNCPRPKNSEPNPQTFWFLVGGTLRSRRVSPSSLDKIMAAFLVQTEYWSEEQMMALNSTG